MRVVWNRGSCFFLQIDLFFSYDLKLLDMIATNIEKICKGLRIYYRFMYSNLLCWTYIVLCIHKEYCSRRSMTFQAALEGSEISYILFTLHICLPLSSCCGPLFRKENGWARNNSILVSHIGQYICTVGMYSTSWSNVTCVCKCVCVRACECTRTLPL